MLAPLVSVVVPVYNVAKFLPQCLDSLLNQTLKNIEIICVDDGSSDDSPKIIQKYAREDARVKYIHQENQGRSVARNTGIDVAKAPYIMFCDSDDWYDKTMCEKMYHALTENHVDFAYCGVQMEYEISNLTSRGADLEYYRVKDSGVQPITQTTWEKVDGSACNKIVKKSLLDKYHLRFPAGLIYEDFCFFFQLLTISKKMYCLPECLYHYRRHADSIMVSTFGKKSLKAIDHIKIMYVIHDFLKRNGFWAKWKETFYHVFLVYFSPAYRFLPDDKKYLAFQTAVPFMKTVPDRDVQLLSPEDQNTWTAILTGKYHDQKRKIKLGGITLIKIKENTTSFKIALLGIKAWSWKIRGKKKTYYLLYIPIYRKEIL